MKQKYPHAEPFTLERLERARAAIAYAMTLDGALYAPVFERLEREIAMIRAADDVMARARRCLDEITPPPLLAQPPRAAFSRPRRDQTCITKPKVLQVKSRVVQGVSASCPAFPIFWSAAADADTHD